jgi:UDPglucose 6-dehydrogenase
MKIAIIGLGFVGLSLTAVLASKGYKTIGVDVDKLKCDIISQGNSTFFEPNLENKLRAGLKKDLIITNNFSMIKNCDYVFVTVGTPQKSNGSIDLSMIKKAVASIGEILQQSKNKPIILIKSTVIPGTIQNVILRILENKSHKKAGKDFGLISNPEFLQESSAIKDTIYPHVVVLGGYKTKFMKKTEEFFSKLHPKTPIIITNHQTAEMIKYANNSFLATKISFINQLSTICQNIPGANVDDISTTIGLDPRIGKKFLNAGPGYGGSCLPKDMKALINFAKQSKVDPTLLQAVDKINENQINNIIIRLKNKLGKLESKNVTILGTAFKPNTDDVRESIAIELIKKLLKLKVNVTIHDPKAINNTKEIFEEKINYSGNILQSLRDSHCAIIMTQWKEYESINNNMIKNMKKKLVFDTRRILAKKKLNADYYAIGIGED